MRTKLKALTADIYRVRQYKSRWNLYRTARGFVVNTGKTYRYFNTGDQFHPKAKAVVDIKGEESVETRYIRLAPKASSLRWRQVTYRRLRKMRQAA